MNRRTLEMHLQDLFEGRLEKEDLQDLQKELRASSEARDAFRDYAHLHNAMGLRADGIDLLQVVPMERVIKRRQRRSLRSALLSAAAVVLVAGIVAAFFVMSQPKPRSLAASATAGAQWTVDGLLQSPSESEGTVTAGSTVQVSSGTVKLGLESGATMVMQGPAKVSFPELDKPVLKSGWLWIDSGESGEPFVIDTPKLLVHDIGTRFGVRVPEKGPTEVHLIEGKIEVFAKSSLEKIAALEPEGRGLSISTDGEPIGLALASDPFPELDQLLATPANYPGTVLGQNPKGYWRLEEAEDSVLANEIREGLIGRRQPKVAMAARGPEPICAFYGFGERNDAVRLSGAPGGVPLSLATTPIHSGLLFRDDFKGPGPLHGAAPAITTREVFWVAAENFKRDGSFYGMQGSATLAFTPFDGVVYTLDTSLREVSGDDYWIAPGFADGQSKASNPDTRFITGSVVGRAWMALKVIASEELTATGSTENKAFLGTTGTNGGFADRVAFSTYNVGSYPDMDLRIILDTSGGPGTWTATWLAKRPGDRNYTTVRERATMLNESISSIGFAVGGEGISGRIESFSLRADRKQATGLEHHDGGAPAKIARKEGAVSFWMRREPGETRQEILWSAGEHRADDAVHAHLTADGRVGFFMENGRYDVLLVSEETIADGNWHHVVASWSPSMVDLFIDGKRVARDSEYRGMQRGILSEFRFGSGPADSGAAPFTGWVDEIALWDRPLTFAEVAHQYQSAKGKPDER